MPVAKLTLGFCPVDGQFQQRQKQSRRISVCTGLRTLFSVIVVMVITVIADVVVFKFQITVFLNEGQTPHGQYRVVK